jgi:hypothetical protein
MNPNNFYRKELMLALFLLLGVNSSWRWFEGNDQEAVFAARKNHTGMAELAATAAADNKQAPAKEKECGTFSFICKLNKSLKKDSEASHQQEQKSDPAQEKAAENPKPQEVTQASASTTKQEANVVAPVAGVEKPKANAQTAEAVQNPKPDTQTTEAVQKLKPKTEPQILKIGDSEYKVNYFQVENDNYAKVSKNSTEASVACDVYCDLYHVPSRVDINSPEALREYAADLQKAVKANGDAKAAKLAKVKANTEPKAVAEQTSAGDDSVAKVDDGKVDDKSANADKNSKDGKVATNDKKTSKDGDDEGDDDDDNDKSDLAQNAEEEIISKCDAYQKNSTTKKFVTCLAKHMDRFAKKTRDKDLKTEVFDDLYNEHIKDELSTLAKSDEVGDRKSAVDIALKLKSLYTEKTSPAIRSQLKDMVVQVESNSFSKDLTEVVKPTALKAAAAYRNWQDALKHNNYAKATQYQIEYQRALSVLNSYNLSNVNSIWSRRKDRIRSEPEWDIIASIYGEGKETEVDGIMNDIYSSADSYRANLYEALMQHKSIDSIIDNEIAQIAGVSSSPGDFTRGNSGIVGVNGFDGGRMARDGARGMFNSMGGGRGAPFIGGRGGNSFIAGSPGIFRNGPQYSSFGPTMLSQPSYLTGNGANNGPFYEWGSVPVPSYSGNGGPSYFNNGGNNGSYFAGNVGSNLGGSTYPNTTNSWGPGNYNTMNGNSFGQPNCMYSSLSPIGNYSSNCINYQNPGMRTGYGPTGGGRFGY